MTTYVDSSVVLRIVLGQRGQLGEWKKIRTAVASGLLEVECLRTLDRLRAAGHLSVEDAAARRAAVFRILDGIDLIEVTAAVLHRAAQPMPAPLGTLDAIHLATAGLWRESSNDRLTVATHDRALALAAQASGFDVVGI